MEYSSDEWDAFSVVSPERAWRAAWATAETWRAGDLLYSHAGVITGWQFVVERVYGDKRMVRLRGPKGPAYYNPETLAPLDLRWNPPSGLGVTPYSRIVVANSDAVPAEIFRPVVLQPDGRKRPRRLISLEDGERE